MLSLVLNTREIWMNQTWLLVKELTDERKGHINKQAVRISCDLCSNEERHQGCGNPTEGSDPAWGVREGILELLTQMLHFVR